MNFLEVRKCIAHMLHQDPMGINDPLVHNGVNESEINLAYPVEGIRCNWKEDKVEVSDIKNDLQYSLLYEDRTEGEVASELVAMINHLR